jgi:hypothetical protein
MDVEGAARHECWAQYCSGCVLSDGRFAVLGGYSTGSYTSSCEALTLGDDEHWAPLPRMRESREYFACAAVAGCVIVAGGFPQRKSRSLRRGARSVAAASA